MSRKKQPLPLNLFAKAKKDRHSVELDLLDLVSTISDVPIRSLQDKAAFEPLVMLLFSEPSHNRILSGDTRCNHFVTARSLIYFGEIAYKPLIDYLACRSFRGERKAILDLLLHQRDEKIFDGLAELYKSGEASEMSGLFAEALIKLNKHKAASIFADVSVSGIDSASRVAATRALGDCFPDDAILSLIASIQDEDIKVAIAAIDALKKIKSPTAIPFLVSAATDYRSARSRFKAISIAQHAIDALAAYNNPETREIVFQWSINHLDSSNISLIHYGVNHLLNLKEERIIPYLTNLIERRYDKQSFGWSRISTLMQKSLREMNTPQTRVALEQIVNLTK